MARRAARWLCAASLLAAAACATAGTLTKQDVARRFPSPVIVGERDATLPVWPLFKQEATATVLVGYAFESADFAAIPGFAGVPMNLLVAIDPQGGFLDVEVLSQHEPVFLDGLGEAPMRAFALQYRGLSLRQNIAVDTGPKSGAPKDGHAVHIDGVSKATASVRILHQTVLSAALQVARRKLGFAPGADPDQVARVDMARFEPMDAAALRREGLVQHLRLSHADVERAYAGSAGEGLDAVALQRPADAFVELDAALLSVPGIGRNLLSARDWQRLSDRLGPGDHALLVTWRGRFAAVADSFTPGTVPDRLLLTQDGLPLELRDLDLDLDLPREALPRDGYKVFRVIAQAGLDPARPLALSLRVTREKGIVYPERIQRDFRLDYRLPGRFVIAPEGDQKGWRPVWRQRAAELAVIVVALVVLAVALARQHRLVATTRRLARFRLAFLAFTLVFLGWHAQAQLSIVHLTGILQALRDGRGLGYLLFDPASVVVGAGVLLSLFAWGRGTFCGWLCPFGALQEFAALAGRFLRLPQRRFRTEVDARLKWLKYVLLALILGSVFLAPAWTDRLVELEPFKTAITLNFVRSWPFVLYAALLLMAGAMYYKFFCRYLCPFGAGLAIAGRVRLRDWLPRRAECGTPCQTCRHRCAYQAIGRDGGIRYDECFQCLDCVAIHDDPGQCAPVMLARKRTIAIAVARQA